MNKYTFFIEGLNKEASIVASSEKDARQSIWKGLSDEEKNAVVVFDCIDIE
jgi:hypothetical protein